MAELIEKQIDKNGVHQRAQEALGHLHATGAVDSEPSALQDILGRMDNDAITPVAALTEIDALLASRQDYH